MSNSIFRLPDALIGNVPQAAAQGQNTLISNWILENPTPTIPETNGTLTAAQIQLLITKIDSHYANAIKAAKVWQNGDSVTNQPAINDEVIDVLNGFVHFSKQFSVQYKKIVEVAYKKDNVELKNQLRRTQRLLEQLINGANGTITSVKNYEEALSSDIADFNNDYTQVMAEVGVVSNEIKTLKTSISNLQKNISDNNREVLNTFIDTAGTELIQGTAMFASAATENGGGVVSAGVQMGVAYVKGIVKTIQLNEKTLEDIKTIRKVGLQVGEDEIILVVLVNIGTRLIALGGDQGIKLDIIKDIVNYWSNLSNGISGLLASDSKDLSSQINTVNFSPETEHYRNPVFPPWNVILPVEKVAKTFKNLINLTTETFGNDTKFEALPSRIME